MDNIIFKQLDFWVTTYSKKADSNHMADILSNYVDATGHAPEPPHYTTGFWQSKVYLCLCMHMYICMFICMLIRMPICVRYFHIRYGALHDRSRKILIFQYQNRYSNQSALLSAAYAYIDRGIPISLIVIDNIRTVPYGNYDFGGSPCWPNPKQMTQDLLKFGIETMVSVWPIVQYNSVNNASFANYHVHCPPSNDFCITFGVYHLLIDLS